MNFLMCKAIILVESQLYTVSWSLGSRIYHKKLYNGE